MESLIKELNTTDNKIGSSISYNFCQNEEEILFILKKYDMNILYEVIDKIKKYQNELFTELVKGYKNGSKETENLKCGFNIINKCIIKINYIINKKKEKEIQKIIFSSIKNCFIILCIIIIILFILLKN
jgi:hypothetical protein